MTEPQGRTLFTSLKIRPEDVKIAAGEALIV
jgi:hypothetical protein